MFTGFGKLFGDTTSDSYDKEYVLKKYALKADKIPKFNHIETEYGDQLGIQVFQGDVQDAIKNGLKWIPYKFNIANIAKEIECSLTSDILNTISQYLSFGKAVSITKSAPKSIEKLFQCSFSVYLILDAYKAKEYDVNSLNVISKAKSISSTNIFLKPILCIETCNARPLIIQNAQNEVYGWKQRRQRADESDMMHVERMQEMDNMKSAEINPFINKLYYYCDEKENNLLDYLRIRNYEKWEKREIVSTGERDWWGNEETKTIKTQFDLFDYCQSISNDQDIYLYAKLSNRYYKPIEYSKGFGDRQFFNFGIVDNDGCFKESHDIYSNGYDEQQIIAIEMAELEAMMK